jgi:hypothetical protein
MKVSSPDSRLKLRPSPSPVTKPPVSLATKSDRERPASAPPDRPGQAGGRSLQWCDVPPAVPRRRLPPSSAPDHAGTGLNRRPHRRPWDRVTKRRGRRGGCRLDGAVWPRRAPPSRLGGDGPPGGHPPSETLRYGVEQERHSERSPRNRRSCATPLVAEERRKRMYSVLGRPMGRSSPAPPGHVPPV